MRRILLVLVLVSACKDDPVQGFDTYQACFDDHTTGGEMLPTIEAIVSCCLEHPINGVSPACKDTVPSCINFLTDNLNQTDASTVDEMDACQMYVDQMAMPPA